MTMSPMLVFKVAYTRPFFSWAGALIANNAAASHAPIRIILFTLFSSFLSEFCYHFVDESQIHVFRRFALWLGIESDRLPLCHQLDALFGWDGVQRFTDQLIGVHRRFALHAQMFHHDLDRVLRVVASVIDAAHDGAHHSFDKLRILSDGLTCGRQSGKGWVFEDIGQTQQALETRLHGNIIRGWRQQARHDDSLLHGGDLWRVARDIDVLYVLVRIDLVQFQQRLHAGRGRAAKAHPQLFSFEI